MTKAYEVELIWNIERSIRLDTDLKNVNANITRILKHRYNTQRDEPATTKTAFEQAEMETLEEEQVEARLRRLRENLEEAEVIRAPINAKDQVTIQRTSNPRRRRTQKIPALESDI